MVHKLTYPEKLASDIARKCPEYADAFDQLKDAVATLCRRSRIDSQERYSAFYMADSDDPITYVDPQLYQIRFGFRENWIRQAKCRIMTKPSSDPFGQWHGSAALIGYDLTDLSFPKLTVRVADIAYLIVESSLQWRESTTGTYSHRDFQAS